MGAQPQPTRRDAVASSTSATDVTTGFSRGDETRASTLPDHLSMGSLHEIIVADAESLAKFGYARVA